MALPGRPEALVICSVPPLTVVAPEYVFEPLRSIVPAPASMMPPVALPLGSTEGPAKLPVTFKVSPALTVKVGMAPAYRFMFTAEITELAVTLTGPPRKR